MAPVVARVQCVAHCIEDERTMRRFLSPTTLLNLARSAAAALVLALLLAVPPIAVEAVEGRQFESRVIGVVPIRNPGRGMPWRARVTVELKDGTRHRLTLPRPHPRVGQTLMLELVDGDLRPLRRS